MAYTPGQIDAVRSFGLRAISTLPGVLIEHASDNNGPGMGTLRWQSGGRLSWKAPGSTLFGPTVQTLVDATTRVTDGADPNKYLRVSIVVAFVPAVEMTAPVYLQRRHGLLGDDPSPGDIDEDVVTLTNISPLAVLNVRVWVPPGSLYWLRKANPDLWVQPTTEATAIQVATSIAPSGGTATFEYERRIPGGAFAQMFSGAQINVVWSGLD